MDHDNLDPADPRLTGDAAGPNRTEKQIKPEPRQTGARLSKKSKKWMAGLGVATVGLVVLGVAVSGHHDKTPGYDDNVDMVGQAEPPSAPPAGGSMSAVSAVAASTGSGAGARLQAQAGQGATAGTGSVLTPAQRYHEWLIEQHYKSLEGQVLAKESAVVAPINKDGGEMGMGGGGLAGPLGGGAASPSGMSPAALLEAALAAAKGGNPSTPGGMGDGGDPQSQNQAFLERQKKAMDANGYLNQALQKPLSPHEITAGSIIPAVMITGINSDLPGEITAQVRQNIYNSLDPSEVLIPQGARLIGEYSSQVAYGQSRVLIAWGRIIFPNGETIALRGMPGVDGIGEAGAHDLVDNHYWKIFGSSILVSLLGVGAQLSQPQSSNALTSPNATQSAIAAMAQQMDSTGTNVLNKNLNIQPTLKIRPGYLFNVLVTRTMILPPYRLEAR
ncbi:TrbI/VirB10 family protein [Acidithiobacillus sp.]|uniref:TrbI/VirB10 family protein n=1 Tax=Acidithiobacillus sp. TaxID=1872118 RepID=UPI003CFF74CB